MSWIFDMQRFAEGGTPAGEAGSTGTQAGGTPAGEVGSTGTQAGGAPAGEAGSTGTQAGGTETILGAKPKETPEQTGKPEGEAPAGEEEKPEETVPEAYDFRDAVPEGMEYSEEAAQEFGKVARELGLSQAHASRLAAYGMEYMQRGVNAALDELEGIRAGWGEEARTQLGKDFDATVAKAAAALEAFQSRVPNLRQALNETGAGNRIEFIRLMAAVGELVGEDRGNGVPGGSGGDPKIYGNTDFDLYR